MDDTRHCHTYAARYTNGHDPDFKQVLQDKILGHVKDIATLKALATTLTTNEWLRSVFTAKCSIYLLTTHTYHDMSVKCTEKRTWINIMCRTLHYIKCVRIN